MVVRTCEEEEVGAEAAGEVGGGVGPDWIRKQGRNRRG